jgi:hypothetical protein
LRRKPAPGASPCSNEKQRAPRLAERLAYDAEAEKLGLSLQKNLCVGPTNATSKT